MPKDYKAYTSYSTRRSSGKKKRWLLWLLVAIILMGIGFTGYWYSKHHATKPAKQNLPIKTTVTPKIADEPQIKFEFYNLLPKENVMVEDNSTSSAPPPPKPKNLITKPTNPAPQPDTQSTSTAGTKYMIQIASLKDPNDADKMKADLLMQGFPAQVNKNTLNNVVWYRVEVGPYLNPQAAAAALNQLKAGHFDGMVKKAF